MTATARALTPTKAISLFAAQVLALCHHNPRFGFLFMRRLAEALAARLNATRLQLLDVYKDELPTIADEPGAGD
jgi:CRP-like cAMP-binding protein